MSEHLLRARERKGKIKRETERGGRAHVNRDLPSLSLSVLIENAHVRYTLKKPDPLMLAACRTTLGI